MAKRGFAVGSIRYPEAKERGVLLYLKATMISGLPPDVVSYKRVNADFPHQPTADASFDETQLEAYRELGYRIAKGLVAENAPASKKRAAGRTRWL